MTPSEMKQRLDEAAATLTNVLREIGPISNKLQRPDDKWAFDSLLTDLAWAAENCSVIGDHQVGRRLDDDMGYRHPEDENGRDRGSS